MKAFLQFFSGLGLLAVVVVVIGARLPAQTPAPAAPATAPVPATTAQPAAAPAPAPAISADDLDQLAGPIALYPDALVALILPASTNSSDVVLAARYLANGGDPAKTDDQPWDDSVKALAHYPDVMKWMDENLEWTKDLGDAYAAQSADVMQSIQRLRAKAKANGVLVDTKEQDVVMDGNNIRIVPAAPDVIYVPQYDPAVVYVDRPVYYGAPYLTFGLGFGVGSWLAYDFDWNRRVIWVVDRHRYPHYRYDWRRHPSFPGHPGPGPHHVWRRWTPPPNRHFHSRPGGLRPNYSIPHPRPFPNSRPGHAPPGHRPDHHIGLREPHAGSHGWHGHHWRPSSAPRLHRWAPSAAGRSPVAVDRRPANLTPGQRPQGGHHRHFVQPRGPQPASRGVQSMRRSPQMRSSPRPASVSQPAASSGPRSRGDGSSHNRGWHGR
jgi:hypothetical protein